MIIYQQSSWNDLSFCAPSLLQIPDKPAIDPVISELWVGEIVLPWLFLKLLQE